LSSTSLERSGRLLIFGSSFGDGTGGEVIIDGLTAIATTWTDTEIHAYVPEAASLGNVSVQVTVDGTPSNVATLDVTTRQAEGRVRWRFQMDSEYPGDFVGVGPDGTVYVTDDENVTVEARMYALTPDGGLKWVVSGAGGARPIAFGPDGTIYTGAYGLTALNPDGTVKWQGPSEARILLVGPSVGPDGNIYAADNTRWGEGLGAFCVDPEGNLLWSDPNPGIQSSRSSNSEIRFASLLEDRLYFCIYSDAGTPPIAWAFDYDGQLQWSQGTCEIDSYAHLNPSGQMVVTGQGLCTVSTIDRDGAVAWRETSPDPGAQYVDPTVGPDGTIYVAGWFSHYIWALDPDGTTKWFRDEPSYGQLLALGVSPDDATIVDGGNSDNLDLVRAFDTTNGDLLWQYELPPEGARHVVSSYRPSFSADSRTAYVTTLLLNYPGYSYLYAMALDETATAVATTVPSAAALLQAPSPNPFRAWTSVAFVMSRAATARLTIHDVTGRLVKTLVNEDVSVGTHTVRWSGWDESGAAVAPGVYFVRLETESARLTEKAIRLR
jgi:hypothetical protein